MFTSKSPQIESADAGKEEEEKGQAKKTYKIT
jgi:hypothetical protein